MNKNLKVTGRNFTPAELENIAKNANFSSFNGEAVDYDGDAAYEGEALYDGSNDDMLDFGGANSPVRSFLQKQANSGRIFTMNIQNSGTLGTDKVIVLNPAYTSEGRAVGAVVVTDGAVQYGALPGDGVITSSGTPKLIQNFLDFVKYNPTQIVGFKVKAQNSSDQLEQAVIIRELSPFKDLESRTIYLSVYQDEDTFRDKVVTVPETLDFSTQSEVTLNLLKDEKVSITLFVGAILNTAVSLRTKYNKAEKTKVKIARKRK